MKKTKSSQLKKNKTALKKQPIKTYIFFAIALVAIIIGFTLITQNYKPFIILLPQEEKTFDSWSLLVRTIEKELGLKRIRLSGYKNFKPRKPNSLGKHTKFFGLKFPILQTIPRTAYRKTIANCR